MGKTAFVNLSSGVVKIEPSDQDAFRQFIGGRGYASKLLFDLVGPDVEPLSPENVLIFSIGPFGGSTWPASGRGHITFKSPMTGAYGHANSGGHFGAELAKADYDAVVVTGSASSPVYLYLTDNQIEIRSAADLWGLEVTPTNERLEPMGKVACIGPAGERQVRFAAIMNDRSRAAARAGAGAVMGNKRLKAVVIKATGRREVPPAFREHSKAVMQIVRTSPVLDMMRRYGTSSIVGIKNISGDLPARNHQLSQVPFVKLIDAEALDEYVVGPHACHACPVHCGRVTEVPEGPYACRTGGPEYETIDALGPMVWLSNLEALIYANLRCNELGLDTISTGAVMAFAMECHEKGILSDPELSLAWGDADSVIGMIERIASRRPGLGDLLAEGTRRASARIGQGAEAYAMQVKGLELTRQEPRIAKGMGLGHVTSNRGPDHLYGLPTIDLAAIWDVAREYFPPEIVDELMDTANETYKPDMLILGEHYCAVADSIGVCKFIMSENWCTKPQDVAGGLGALWGRSVTSQELLTYGERIVNLERLYNVRQGLSRADDRLPARFTTEPLDILTYVPDPETGWGVPVGEPARKGAIVYDLDGMLDRYYRLRGWGQDGKPTMETASRLGLEAYARSALSG